MEYSTTVSDDANRMPRQRRFRFQYSLRTLLLVVTACAMLLSYWASTRPVLPSAFLLTADKNYRSPGPPNAGEMIDQTLKKLCGGSKGVHAFYSSSGRDPDGRGDVTIDALVILPKQLHKQYHDELRQMWLDLLDKTQCTVESDEPLPDHTEGFVVTYTTGIKQGTLRVCCKPGGDRINSHSEGRVTNVPYKDDILNVIIELRETKR